jgi:hypothetical protein
MKPRAVLGSAQLLLLFYKKPTEKVLRYGVCLKKYTTQANLEY